MATGWFGPCPHCNSPLSYLEGVSGSTMTPRCPRCQTVVPVTRATFLMADNSRPSPPPSASVKATPKPTG
jgi:phage FluMu protein Com